MHWFNWMIIGVYFNSSSKHSPVAQKRSTHSQATHSSLMAPVTWWWGHSMNFHSSPSWFLWPSKAFGGIHSCLVLSTTTRLVDQEDLICCQINCFYFSIVILMSEWTQQNELHRCLFVGKQQRKTLQNITKYYRCSLYCFNRYLDGNQHNSRSKRCILSLNLW